MVRLLIAVATLKLILPSVAQCASRFCPIILATYCKWRRGRDSKPPPFARNPTFLRVLRPRLQPICTPIVLYFAPCFNAALTYNHSLGHLKLVVKI
jgi:hypothetical protein